MYRERQGGGPKMERVIFHPLALSPDAPTTQHLEIIQDPGTQSESSVWLAGTKAPAVPTWYTLAGSWDQKPRQHCNQETPMWDAGFPSGILTAMPNTLIQRVLMLKCRPCQIHILKAFLSFHRWFFFFQFLDSAFKAQLHFGGSILVDLSFSSVAYAFSIIFIKIRIKSKFMKIYLCFLGSIS